jgi:Arc/MetJ-type ribon-helix-helix transcriptional regulator
VNTKSSITLPAEELKSVEELRERLGARTKVEVIRRAIRLLRESTDRAELRRAYQEASRATRAVTLAELADLEGLTADGLDG